MAFKSIPASTLAAIYPAVLGAGGNPLGLNANVLDDNAVFPSYEYTSNVLVGQHFGLTSDEYKFATVYFNGFNNATTRPNSLFITRHNSADRAAQLIGGSVKGVSIAQLKTITAGLLEVTVDGDNIQASPIDFSSVNSFSDAATVLSTATEVPVTYDPQLEAFIIKSTTVGEGSTLSFAERDVAELLNLTQAKGALVDNDTLADTSETATKRMLDYTSNFANITYIGDSFDDATIKELATWVTTQNGRYHLYTYGIDPLALTPNNSASFGAWAKEYTAGITPLYGALDKAAFFCAIDASINYEETNGRTTTAFRSQDGLVPEVTSESDADALVSNGYSYYGAWATANERFLMAGNGQVTGDFKWIDNYMFQVFLNSQFQLALVNMLTAYKSIPYNADGSAIINAVLTDPINAGVNFGGIRSGIELTSQQADVVARDTGIADAGVQIYAKGWVLSIDMPSAQVRAERGSPIIKFYYTDGSSIQRIEMTSTNVQ